MGALGKLWKRGAGRNQRRRRGAGRDRGDEGELDGTSGEAGGLDGTSGDEGGLGIFFAGELGLAANSDWFGRRGLEFNADLTDVKDGSNTFALMSALLEAHFRARGYTDFTAGGSWLVGTSSTVKDEPASMSTRSIYCAREPVVVAGRGETGDYLDRSRRQSSKYHHSNLLGE